MTLSRQSSNIINLLKCILCIGVVFIHARFRPGESTLLLGQAWGGAISDYQVIINFIYFISELVLNHVCVPLFFLISGYLFFLKQPAKGNELQWFIKKWQSRFWSLLIPYIIANTIFNLGEVLISVYNGTEVDFGKFLRGYWALDHSFPVDLPTWFLRDLILAVALTPFIMIGIRKTSFLLPLILGIMWMLEDPIGISLSFWKPRAYFFFSLGAWFSIHEIDIMKFVKTDWNILIYLIIYLGTVFLYTIFNYEWIINMSVILGFPVFISLSKVISKGIQNPISTRIVAITFFIFLYHYYFAVSLWRLICLIIGTSELALFGAFVGGAVITIIGLSIAYLLLERFSPQILGLMVGGRI